MFGAKCKEHPDVELQREYPREGHGIYVEYCPKCRENSPIRQLFNQAKSAELDTMEQNFTDVQQLKAEIAALIAELETRPQDQFLTVSSVIKLLRQLSAV